MLGSTLPNQDADYEIGDMILNPAQYRAFYGNDDETSFTNEMQNAIQGDQYRWKDGIVPYEISDNFLPYEKKRIKMGISRLNRQMENCIYIV